MRVFPAARTYESRLQQQKVQQRYSWQQKPAVPTGGTVRDSTKNALADAQELCRPHMSAGPSVTRPTAGVSQLKKNVENSYYTGPKRSCRET